MNCYDYKKHKQDDEVMKRVGYAYVPAQYLDKVYAPDKALWRGTIFPELDISINEYERGLYDGK